MDSVHYFTNPIQMIEGFDMVGKTTFMENNFSDYLLYHCRHDLTDETIGRHNSWAIGYGIIDLVEQVHLPDNLKTGILIDRGVFSSYVYDRLYNNHYLDPKILDWYKNNEYFKNKIGHIYIRHHDAQSAQEIFERAQMREPDPNEISRKYDQFKDFNDYWLLYNYADQLFKEAYDYIGVTPRIFETIPEMKWSEIVL